MPGFEIKFRVWKWTLRIYLGPDRREYPHELLPAPERDKFETAPSIPVRTPFGKTVDIPENVEVPPHEDPVDYREWVADQIRLRNEDPTSPAIDPDFERIVVARRHVVGG